MRTILADSHGYLCRIFDDRKLQRLKYNLVTRAADEVVYLVIVPKDAAAGAAGLLAGHRARKTGLQALDPNMQSLSLKLGQTSASMKQYSVQIPDNLLPDLQQGRKVYSYR